MPCRKRPPPHTLLSAGLTLVGVGVLLLLVLPAAMRPSQVINAMLEGLRTPGKVALVLGAVLLGLHAVVVLVKRQRDPRVDAEADVATPVARRRGRAATKPAAVSSPTPAPAPAAAVRTLAPAAAPAGGAINPALDSGAPDAGRTAAELSPPTAWGADVFSVIEWRRFEAVVEQLFAQAGFETRAQSHGADGGVDVWLHSRHASGPVSVVQCKHWQGKPVGVQQMREFLGVMASHGIQRGTYATTSRFTADALAFARANGINAQDGDGLLKLIAARTPDQQAALLATALQGEYWRPTCPSCGVKMTDRSARKTGDRFWGCIHYPRCKYTQPMASLAQARLTGPTA